MAEYKPNSNRYKEEQRAAAEEERKVQKVVQGSVRTKKKSEIRKFADVFLAKDMADVKNYAIQDVLWPAIKKGIWDIVTGGLDMLLFGGSGRTSGGRPIDTPKVSYRNYYDSKDPHYHRVSESRPRDRFDFDELVYDSKGEAEAVLQQMDEMLDRYGVVTVADMYESAGLSQPYTSNKYGWTSLRTAETVRLSGGGYVIKLPKAMPID